MKKVFAMIFALTLCIGLLAGCEITPAETVSATTSEPAGTTAPTHETQPTGTEPAAYSFEGKTLDVCAGHSAAMDGTDLNRFIESTLGIDIRWVVLPGMPTGKASMNSGSISCWMRTMPPMPGSWSAGRLSEYT